MSRMKTESSITKKLGLKSARQRCLTKIGLIKNIRKRATKMQTLNIKDLAIALNAFRTIEGRKWKSKLRDAWATGNWGSHKHYVPLLQSFRNRGGIDLLDKIHWALAQDEIEKVLIAGGVK